MNGQDQSFGAAIERGAVSSADGERYRVISLSRSGMETPPIPAIGGALIEPGDIVFFFLFDDGYGMILGRLGG